MAVIFDPILGKLRTSDATVVPQLRGNWDAGTNTPDITAENTPGDYWVVQGPGVTDLDGITTWFDGDIARVASDGDFARIPAIPDTAYTETFVNADLVANVLTVAHGLGQLGGLAITVSDENGVVVLPVLTFVNADTLTLDFTGFTPLPPGPKDWTVGVIKAGGTAIGTANPMTAAADMIVGGASGVPAKLVKGTALQVLRMNAAATAQEYADAQLVGSYRNLYIDADAMVPCTTAGAAAGTKEYGTNDIEFDYFAFDGGATEERIQFKIAMPDEWDKGTVKAKFFWSSAAGSTAGDTVEFGIKAGAISNDDAIDAALGTAVTVSDTLLANDGADMQVSAASAAITVGGTPALGDMVAFEVYRNTDGTDDMTEDAWLFGVQIQFKETTTAVAAW